MYGCLSAFTLFLTQIQRAYPPNFQYADLQNFVIVRDGIYKTFKEPRNRFQGIDSTRLCSLRARICKPFKKPRNRFPARWNRSLGIDSRLHKRLQIRALAGRYDNPIPTRFLALMDCSKIPPQNGNRCEFVPPQDVHISQVYI
jgi:hypothetical protein